ncbi:HD domain-containing protein [Fodinisporobacter ferrooxydans]|uniref:HD domain-containing protein n=1 Tax=Fodinisporobacter ferrooxydans TaxID=2901836 RepID=A0ABY4CL04_9BACL|nr:HD domain-containing protein [Alicyclobacillaceae bacterium MYW30-H2]
MSIHAYFKSLMKLERIVRCPGEFKMESHNVSSHSWKVAQYCQFLGEVEEQHGANINWKSLYEKAINHDYAEIFIGDIKTPVKYASVELRNLLQQVEEGMTKQFVDTEFPEQFRQLYHEKLKEGKDTTLEGMILTVADKMDQVYEAFTEIQKGNSQPAFIIMYQDALKAIRKIPLKCVEYFLDVVLEDMINDETIASVDIKQITGEALKNSSI